MFKHFLGKVGNAMGMQEAFSVLAGLEAAPNEGTLPFAICFAKPAAGHAWQQSWLRVREPDGSHRGSIGNLDRPAAVLRDAAVQSLQI